MKTLRAILIAVVLLSLLASSAEASGSKLGFIPLLSRIDPSTPVEIQAQEALRPIMPQLLAAQISGQIVEFGVSAGVLKIKFGQAAGKVAVFQGLPVYDDMQEAVAVIHMPSPLSRQLRPDAVVAAAGTGAYFSMQLYNNCFEATGLTANAHVTGSLRDKAGRIVSLYDSLADASGTISFGCFSWSGSFSDIMPGYKVVFNEYDGIGTLLKTYQATAPVIKFTSIDKTNSIVRGTAPASKSFTASWYHRNWNAANTFLNPVVTKTTSAVGTWMVDFGTVKIRGNDHLTASVVVNPYFQFGRWMDVPRIYCELASNYCDLTGFAFTSASMKIIRGTKVYNFPGKFGDDGHFRLFWQTTAGDPIFLRVGDKVGGTGVPAFALPNITAAINPTTNVVSGSAPKYRYFDLWTQIAATGSSYKVYSHANSSGNYASNFATQVDLKAGEPTTVQLYFVNPATGNAVDYFKSFGP